MMLRSLGLTAVLAATLAGALAACASGPPERPEGHGGPGGRGGPPGEGGASQMPQLFISPAGEPFRAPPGAPYPIADWFAGADANHDGALTRDEFVADSVRFFNVVDVDHNGTIDGFEVANYEQRIAPEIIGGAAPGGMRRGPRGLGGGQDDNGPVDGDMAPSVRRRSPGTNVLQGASLFSLIAEPEPVMAADGNFDRRITKDEAIKAAKTRFALLDTDKDGLLKLAELPKTPIQGGLRPGASQGGGKGGKTGGAGRGGGGRRGGGGGGGGGGMPRG